MVASVFIDEKGKKAVLAFHMHNFTSHNTLTVICASPGAFCLTFSEGHFQTPSKVRSDPVVWEHHLILNPSFEFVFSLHGNHLLPIGLEFWNQSLYNLGLLWKSSRLQGGLVIRLISLSTSCLFLTSFFIHCFLAA